MFSIFSPVTHVLVFGQVLKFRSSFFVFTCQSNEDNEVLYADSLSAKNFPNSNVQIQIAQIYGRSPSNLSVHTPKVQQQPNSFDCGTFAIAYAVEFCLNPKTYTDRQNFDFRSSGMS